MTATHEQITDLISGYTDLKQYFETYRSQMQPFLAAVEHPHQVTLEVGEGKAFAHPVDAYLHIHNHAMNHNIAWKMVVYPGVYSFPYKGRQGCHFHHSKHVTIVSSTNKAADVIFEGNGEHHAWLLIGDHHCHLIIRHITFRDTRKLTSSRVDAVNNRNYVNNNAGGINHGVLVRYGSTLSIAHCQFQDLWHSISLHDSSQAYIDECNGINTCHGVWLSRTSFAQMNKCQWTGVGDIADSWRYGGGVGTFHGSVLHARGNMIKNFNVGVYGHWSSNVHFNRFYRWGGTDGRTPVDIVNGHIEQCRHGVHVWHHSGGHFTDLSILSSQSHAFLTGMSSSTYAHSNVIIDGADIGFYCRHSASIVANTATVRNCRSYGFHAAYLSEIHAASTQAHVSGNANNYSPAASHTPGNHAGQIYIS